MGTEEGGDNVQVVGGGIGDATDVNLDEERRGSAAWSDRENLTFEPGDPPNSSVTRVECTVTALPSIKST